MRNRKLNNTCSFTVNKGVEGDRLENVLARMLSNGEVIGTEAPLIYTERREGVGAAYNIRTDRFDLAIDGMTKVEASRVAKRTAQMAIVKEGEEKDGEAEPVGGQAK